MVLQLKPHRIILYGQNAYRLEGVIKTVQRCRLLAWNIINLTPNVDARYVRININSSSYSTFVPIKEFEVWGSNTPGLPGAPEVQAVWVDNIKYTTTTSTHDDIPTDIENELHIARGTTTEGTDYKFIGGIHKVYRYWKNYLYTDTDVTNLYTNKQTVWNIPIGAVAFAGYTLVLAESEDYGFVDDGYDTTGVLMIN